MNIQPDVLDVLNQSRITEDKVYLPATLERSLYEKVNKVLTISGGKWNRKEKAHVFSSDPREKLGMAVDTGKIIDAKKEYQAFYTPRAVACKLVDYADIKEGNSVLEPSCGNGAIVREISISAASHLDCVELNPEAAEYVKENYEVSVQVADFLTLSPKPSYDRVIMNPPFSKSQDVKHVMHAFKFLKPEGVLVAILSPSFSFRKDKVHAEFNALMETNGEVIEELPEGTFKESGTNIQTLIVKLVN